MAYNKSNIYLNNQNLPSVHAEYEYTPKMVKEIKKCASNLLYFAETYFHVVSMDTEGKHVIKLYDAQKRVLKSLFKNRFVVTMASRQSGKALDIDTPILTETGWKTMGEIKDGDRVYDEHGNFCTVLMAHEVMHDRKCYEVVFDNGETIVADEEHLWTTQTCAERKRTVGPTWTTKTTKEIFNTIYRPGEAVPPEPNHRIMVGGPLIGKNQDLVIDPYLLGVWLGDGSSAQASVWMGKQDCAELVANLNQPYARVAHLKDGNFKVYINGENQKDTTDCFKKQLRRLNLLDNKHIPESYLRADRESRLELLRGLMDTDGYICKKGTAYFYNVSRQLADNVEELITGLGYKVYRQEKIPTIYGKKCNLCYVLFFTPRELVVKLRRKQERLNLQQSKLKRPSRANYHYIKEIREVSSRPVRCLTVDNPTGLYLCGRQLIPTHNTTLMNIYALWNACFKNDQRIVIVANKEETAKMILRRIRMAYEYLPNWVKPAVKKWGETEVVFNNDSSITISTTTSTAIRGESVNVLIIDEMAFIPEHIMEEFWNSVIPVISSARSTKIFAVSTPNGCGNHFYELYTKTERGENSEWDYQRIDWWDVPGRGQKWKKEMLEALGSEESFEQEFGNKFLETGEITVDKETLEKMRQLCLHKKPLHVIEDGHYKIFESPDESHIYVFGVDIGEGIRQAASVVQVLDITDLTNIRQAAIFHDNLIDPPHFAEVLFKMSRQWGRPYMMIERNNQGVSVIDSLYNIYKYDHIVEHSPETQKGMARLGVYSHINSKYRGVINMRYWLNSMKVVELYDIGTVQELETFIRYPNGHWKKRAGEGVYDDRVMALVWALFILDPEVATNYFDIVAYDDRGKPLKIQTETKEDKMYFNLPQDEISKYPDEGGNPLPIMMSNGKDDEGEMQDLEANGWRMWGNG